MSALRDPEGDPANVVWWKTSERTIGWSAVGYDHRNQIAYECHHGHDQRRGAFRCGRRVLGHAKGPSQ